MCCYLSWILSKSTKSEIVQLLSDAGSQILDRDLLPLLLGNRKHDAVAEKALKSDLAGYVLAFTIFSP
jgi:hypothetical protein